MNFKKLNPKKIFLDRDGDGLTDSIDLQLRLSPSCSNLRVLSAVMDLSACLGFESVGMDLPLVKAGEGRDASFRHHLYIGLEHELRKIFSKRKGNDYFLEGKDEIVLANAIRDFSFSLISEKAVLQKDLLKTGFGKRESFDLLNLFSNQGFYFNSSKSILPFLFPYKILLLSPIGLEAGVEAANFAARLGLESLHLSLPFTFPFKERPKHQKHFIYIGKKEDLKKHGSVGFKDVFNNRWDSGIFLLPYNRKIPDVLICGEDGGLRNLLKYLSCIPTSSRGVEDPVFDSIKRFFEGFRDFMLGGGSKKEDPPPKIIKEYTIPDERKEIAELLKGGLKDRRPKSHSLDIQIFLARPEKVRRRWRGEIQRWLKRFGIPEEEMGVTVLNAYKPGLSWMREVVLKEIDKKRLDKIEIAFKQFKTKGLEEPIRWLEEIYPIDEIFASSLSIPKERIAFKKDSRIREVYRVRGWRRGKVIYENKFSPQWIEQPYLIPFPQLGKVHPCTGWVRMKVDGVEVVNQRVKTPIERIWDVYQNEILTLIQKQVHDVLRQRIHFSPGPIFQELRFDVYFDYPMEPLPMDEERISPLEALHEEIYFVTLDFFYKFLKYKRIKNLSAGRILPIIHPDFRGKGGRLKLTLIHKPRETSISQKVGEFRINLNGIVFNRKEVRIDFFIEGGKEKDLRLLRKRLRAFRRKENGLFKINKIFEENHYGRRRFHLVASGKDFIRKDGFSRRRVKSKAIEIPMDRPIGYREGVRLTKSLEGLPGVQVVEEGRSFGGLPIFSIENTFPSPSLFTSHAKRILFKPTFFVNCRHHANEVSSTNAGLKLSYLLATSPSFRKLLRKINVLINPMENVDGMAILEEMLRLTPTDKLHAGRYNKAGQEYYLEYFNPKTPFGEAKARPAIWKRWLPDICVDNHGFPSHEWEQTFSGYAPFRFREFWIPRALFYLYLPFLEEKVNSPQRINSEVLKNWIATAISKEKEIARCNQNSFDRYVKYRQQWFKKMVHQGGSIQCLPLQKRFRRTNYSYRYPHITTVDFITEVADETAQGRFLKTCATAHLEANFSIIQLLSSFNISDKKLYDHQNQQAHFLWYRERPLRLKNLRKEG